MILKLRLVFVILWHWKYRWKGLKFWWRDVAFKPMDYKPKWYDGTLQDAVIYLNYWWRPT